MANITSRIFRIPHASYIESKLRAHCLHILPVYAKVRLKIWVELVKAPTRRILNVTFGTENRFVFLDLTTLLYSNLYINLSSKLERPLMELLARETLAKGSVDMISKIYDQNLEFVSLEQRLFSLDRPGSYVQYNDPEESDNVSADALYALDLQLQSGDMGEDRSNLCCTAARVRLFPFDIELTRPIETALRRSTYTLKRGQPLKPQQWSHGANVLVKTL